MLAFVTSDSRRAPFRVPDQMLRGTTPVVIASSLAQPVDRARAALLAVGGQDLGLSEDGLRMVGWIGSAWTNIPSHQQYELLVDIRCSSSVSEFRCMARPRWAASRGGASRARDLALKLRVALSDSEPG